MGLFSKREISLDSRIAAGAITSDPSDSRKIAKAQEAILATLRPSESIAWAAADISDNSVMVLTNERILSFGGSQLGYIVDGSRVAATKLGQMNFYGRGHSFKHSMTVTWRGGPLKHQSIKNYESPNMFLMIVRWEYDEINEMCISVDRQFGIA